MIYFRDQRKDDDTSDAYSKSDSEVTEEETITLPSKRRKSTTKVRIEYQGEPIILCKRGFHLEETSIFCFLCGSPKHIDLDCPNHMFVPNLPHSVISQEKQEEEKDDISTTSSNGFDARFAIERDFNRVSGRTRSQKSLRQSNGFDRKLKSEFYCTSSTPIRRFSDHQSKRPRKTARSKKRAPIRTMEEEYRKFCNLVVRVDEAGKSYKVEGDLPFNRICMFAAFSLPCRFIPVGKKGAQTVSVHVKQSGNCLSRMELMASFGFIRDFHGSYYPNCLSQADIINLRGSMIKDVFLSNLREAWSAKNNKVLMDPLLSLMLCHLIPLPTYLCPGDDNYQFLKILYCASKPVSAVPLSKVRLVADLISKVKPWSSWPEKFYRMKEQERHGLFGQMLLETYHRNHLLAALNLMRVCA